ncbi:hypothetical protein B0G69_1201 [Paraburkholderia sp. RAU2J]|uniref:hypothetical protein n=1 Tax=Paraburkholderia sp. RAU2J TaxID=1938810 RepID=UPI000EB55655|nr:hypothetical protein [Paraburkholderia sp. RAU2J]RKT25485.1 hypothetical protein B0G69_1201 [Paraburkholderia sp. RAU2J]
MNTNVENTIPATKVCHAVPGEMDTMKMRGYQGPTNGAHPVDHSEASRLAAAAGAEQDRLMEYRDTSAQAALVDRSTVAEAELVVAEAEPVVAESSAAPTE